MNFYIWIIILSFSTSYVILKEYSEIDYTFIPSINELSENFDKIFNGSNYFIESLRNVKDPVEELYRSVSYIKLYLKKKLYSAISNGSQIEGKSISKEEINTTVESLKKFLSLIQESKNPRDRKKTLKGYAFLGYLILTNDYTRIKRSRDDSIGIINYFEKAIQIYEKYLNYPQEKDLMYYVYLQQSRLLNSISRPHDAKIKVELALKLAVTPEEVASALGLRGDIYLVLGEVALAALDFEKALGEKPYDFSIYEKLVSCYKHMNSISKNKWRNLFLTIENLNNVRIKENSNQIDLSEEILENDDEQKFIEAVDIFSDHRFPKHNKAEVFTVRLSINHSEPLNGYAGVYQALFDSAEMAGLYKEAWYYLNERNKIKLEEYKNSIGNSLDGSIISETERVEFIKKTFVKNFWPNDTTKVGSQSKVPVFIVGMMRSGSTLLESMLYSHPNILTIGEESIIVDEISQLIHKKSWLKKSTQQRRNSYVEDEFDEFDEFEIDKDVDYNGNIVDPSKTLDDIINDHALNTLDRMRKTSLDIFKYSSKFQEGAEIKNIIDKMLFNYMNIGFIHLFFPNALIIHTVRDPLDTLISCFRMNFGNPRLSWTLSLDSLLNGYKLYLEVMDHFRSVLPGKILEIQYENLVKEPEKNLRNILGRLQLNWDKNVLNYDSVNRTVLTSSVLQVKKRLYFSSINSWKKYAIHIKELAYNLSHFTAYFKKRNNLPFLKSINWDLDYEYEYL